MVTLSSHIYLKDFIKSVSKKADLLNIKVRGTDRINTDSNV